VSRDNLYDGDVASRLKQMITDELVMVEQKFVAARPATNRMSWLFTSNDTIPVKIEGDHDRRYSVLRNINPPTPDHRAMLTSFYEAKGLSPEFVGTEVAAFMHTLLSTEVDQELLRLPLKNRARELAIKAGANSVEAFGEELRERGLEALARRMNMASVLAKHAWLKEGRVERDSVFAMYKLFVEENGFKSWNRSKFRGEIRRVFPGLKEIRTTDGRRPADDPHADRNFRPWVYEGLPTYGAGTPPAPATPPSPTPSGPYIVPIGIEREASIARSSGSIEEMFQRQLDETDEGKKS
jgi:hypothetical protein